MNSQKLFKVTFSPEREIDNLMELVWNGRATAGLGTGYSKESGQNNPSLPEWFRVEIKKCKHEWEARKVISKLVDETWFKKTTYPISEIESNIEKYLNSKTSDYLKIIESSFKKEFPVPNVFIYLTSVTLCPYFGDNSFMLVIGSDKQERDQAVIHELNHITFNHYFPYSQYSQQLTFRQYIILFESFTVLTNPEESGYPACQQIRKLIVDLDRKKYSIQQIIQNILDQHLLQSDNQNSSTDNYSHLSFRDILSLIIHEFKKRRHDLN